ncbi:preprotein translocase subunit SecY [Aristophania vespae]|uniref:Protein translocase subunit SecY n=1 Tax=Aristophania vespae TaxID=2697033 RepID=A0A6P1NC17_9PROT|nr:preprotein translocase subunit SecY [Aristophania vespae]QHI95886.1 preprotein translocase subunit SecY [Aristophania vespae]UMM63616.1 Protein translocase subunit SecY [Aristophania vespae]
MASVAEQLAANLNFNAFSKATELKKRIWFTLGALIVYRLGTFIPVPGIDASVLGQIVSQNQGGILGMFDMFSGGALGRMTVFALNIMPYISASIIIQLLSTALPSMEALKKEGESGRKKLNQYTRYLTVIIAIVQAYGFAMGLSSLHTQNGLSAIVSPGFSFIFSYIVMLVTGTMFLMWLGEQITSRGIGNGISLIIFSGIVANLPHATASLFELGRTGALSPLFVAIFLVLALAVVAFIVFMEQAQRRVIIQYPKRQVGNRVYGGDSTHMPLKVNTAGVIPPIFASSVLLIPATLTGFLHNNTGWLGKIGQLFSQGHPLYMVFYALMIIFFSYFYAAVTFNPEETAENLRKQGGFVPGIRPGANTARYFDKILSRLTTIGAAYMVLVCLLPQILISRYNVPFYFGGTSLIIIVSVTIDTVTQVQSHLVAHQYQGLIRKQRGRGTGRVKERGK